jgi:hypothetical protein
MTTVSGIAATPTRFVDHLKFWKRHSWRDFYFEYAVLSVISLYFLMYTLGRKRNRSLAQRWLLANRPLLNNEFAQFGIPSVDGRVVPLSHDGAGVYETYATGRINIHRLWVEIKTISRHDLVAFVFESVAGFLFESFSEEGDVVQVIIEPNVEWEGFTWGVVKKSRMRRLRESRYDLVWFP